MDPKVNFEIALKTQKKRWDMQDAHIDAIANRLPQYDYVFDVDVDKIPQENREQVIKKLRERLAAHHCDFLLEYHYADAMALHDEVFFKWQTLHHRFADMLKLEAAAQQQELNLLTQEIEALRKQSEECDALLEAINENYPKVYQRFDKDRKALLHPIINAVQDGTNVAVAISTAIRKKTWEAEGVASVAPEPPKLNFLQRHPYVAFGLQIVTLALGMAAIAGVVVGAGMIGALPTVAAVALALACGVMSLGILIATLTGIAAINIYGKVPEPVAAEKSVAPNSTTSIAKTLSEHPAAEKTESKAAVVAPSTTADQTKPDPQERSHLIDLSAEDDLEDKTETPRLT